MGSLFQTSRRDFFKGIGAAGLTVVFNKLAVAAQSPSQSWSGRPGNARYRIEGVEKVTGQKIYARDFRARDMKGWPAHERVATILRVTDVTRLFAGIDLSMLPKALQPLTCVTGDMLTADKIVPPYGTSPPTQNEAKIVARQPFLNRMVITPLSAVGRSVKIRDWVT